jgi:hypothetical protein
MGAGSAVVTTTAQASRAAGGARPAGESGPSAPRVRRLTTPARLWAALLAAAFALLAVGATCGATLAARQDAQTRSADTAERLLVNVDELYHALAEADATAATALLVGPVPPPRLAALYSRDIAQADDALATASRQLAGDELASAQLGSVAAQLPQYTAYIATAQADNRLGFPVAGAYLREASQLMHQSMLVEVKKVADDERAAHSSAQARVRAVPLWIIVITVLAAALLVLVGRELYASTHRRFNAGILAGALVAVGVVLWSLVAVSSAQGHARHAQADFDGVVTVLDARSDLAIADSYTALTLADRGEDAGLDASNEADALRRLDASKLSGQVPALPGYRHQLGAVGTAVEGGDFYTAIKLVVGQGAQAAPDTVNADSAAVDQQLVTAFNSTQAAYTADAGAAGSALGGGLWIGLAGGVLAAVAAALGVNRRLAEYR